MMKFKPFRVWSKIKRKFIKIDFLTLSDKWKNTDEKYDFYINSFTGFLDKDKRQIFEEDFVENENKIRFLVRMDNESKYVYFEQLDNGQRFFTINPVLHKLNFIKIIGNIYENN